MGNIDWEAINPLHGNLNYLKDLTDLAKGNRKKQTLSEEKLWNEVLRDKKTGYKFIRQKPIHRCIVDFYCSKLCLAIEIDGGSHIDRKGLDKYRDQFLKQIGIQTIRFSDIEVINNIEGVKVKIKQLCISSPVKGR
jgi:very-short-patch-repair endonuclease